MAIKSDRTETNSKDMDFIVDRFEVYSFTNVLNAWAWRFDF